ncbi:MAG: cobalamin-binding protein [Candidatus Eisenbacteria bacterium]|nr:cobalamin-binding protein [Candidatus Latescibacterota bacterium]MBD3301782.1 cobalamin-binding protein [Candidatus Eisenbacteria bacterium]
MDRLEEISRALQQGDEETVSALTRAALEEKRSAREVLEGGLIAGMDVVGDRFRAHEVFLPDVLLAARAMIAGMEVLRPVLLADRVPSRGKVVIGTVQGDLHDIGKNLVGVMLRGAGFDVIDLGSDVSPEGFVDAALENEARLIGMSALLTTTMPVMRRVVALLSERGLRDRIRVIVGGAPVSTDFAREIGADSYAYDAANAVQRVEDLLR